ncbi:MAG: DUF4388 domain-containing protein [Deltaproteobacteria bacterium]|nr:DUF4388 domain-containing protein [Deltaproteobacteria bacterium]
MNKSANFSGDLKFIGLADIFQILGGNSNSGVLHLTSHYAANQGLIYFLNGSPIDAANGPLKGIDAIYAVFGWSEGKFEFREEEVHRGHVINSNRMEIVMDAMRMLDEGMIKRVGPRPGDGGSIEQNNVFRDVDGKGLVLIRGPLVDYTYVVEENSFCDGERIIKEGAHGSWIWVILEGMVEIKRESSRGPIQIARLGDGCFIGTFTSLVFREYSRNASVTALGDVHLGLLDTLRLSGDYASLSEDFRRFLLSLTGRLKRLTDKAVDLEMNNGRQGNMIRGSRPIMERELHKNDLFSITEGDISVMERRNGYQQLVTLGKEDFFGHVPFMDTDYELCNTAAIPSDDLVLDRVDSVQLQREYDKLSTTFRNLVDNIGSCVSETTKLLCNLKLEDKA